MHLENRLNFVFTLFCHCFFLLFGGVLRFAFATLLIRYCGRRFTLRSCFWRRSDKRSDKRDIRVRFRGLFFFLFFFNCDGFVALGLRACRPFVGLARRRRSTLAFLGFSGVSGGLGGGGSGLRFALVLFPWSVEKFFFCSIFILFAALLLALVLLVALSRFRSCCISTVFAAILSLVVPPGLWQNQLMCDMYLRGQKLPCTCSGWASGYVRRPRRARKQPFSIGSRPATAHPTHKTGGPGGNNRFTLYLLNCLGAYYVDAVLGVILLTEVDLLVA